MSPGRINEEQPARLQGPLCVYYVRSRVAARVVRLEVHAGYPTLLVNDTLAPRRRAEWRSLDCLFFHRPYPHRAALRDTYVCIYIACIIAKSSYLFSSNWSRFSYFASEFKITIGRTQPRLVYRNIGTTNCWREIGCVPRLVRGTSKVACIP